MDQQEFRQKWLPHHQCCFPGIGRWLNGFPEEGDVNRLDIVKRWYVVLRDVKLDDAVEASNAMLAGDLPEPRGFDRHVTAIRQHAIQSRNNQRREYRPCYVDGEQTVDCAICEDDGWVTIWGSIAMQAAQQGQLGEHGTLSTAAVACNCGAGRKHEKCKPLVFDARKMLPVQCKHAPKEQAALVEFVSRSMEWRPAMSYEEVCGAGS